MKRGCAHIYGIAFLLLALSVATLSVDTRPSFGEEMGKVVYVPDDEVLATLSYSRACKKVKSEENEVGVITNMRNCITNIQISSDKLTWIEDYPWMETPNSYRSYSLHIRSMDVRITRINDVFRVYLGQMTGENHGFDSSVTTYSGHFLETKNKDKALSLADAFYVLKRYAEGYKPQDRLAAQTTFENEAKSYREMAVKPALSQDVQGYRVAAEDAFRNKNFEKALKYYEKGLSIQPLWPQGQFNAALLYGELEDYEMAALHMKRYLELLPDAGNANAAREKILLWEVKAKEETGK